MAQFRDYTDIDLLQAERDLFAFAESFTDPIIIISSQGIISHCNKSLVKQLGYTPSEILGVPFEQLFTNFDFENCMVLGQTDMGHQALRMNCIVTHKNRSPLNASLTIFMFHIGKSPIASTVAATCRLAPQTSTVESVNSDNNAQHNQHDQPTAELTNHTIIGTSCSIDDIRNMIDLVGKTDSSVLITGESGTGKELVAEALHAASSRADYPLVKLNCAALPETLLESELFGYMKGSFTGAVKDSFGMFKAADGGTLFLDEIGEIATTGQGKLLHVLESQEFHRIGESIPIKTDARILAATNQYLPGRIQQGLFREDLYYRLNVFEIQIPPLRKRIEDIPALVEHFLKTLNKKLKKSIHSVSDEVLNFFSTYSWPGNVRELAHALEHACVLCQNKVIHKHHLPPELQKNKSMPDRLPEQNGMQSADRIRNILIKTGGNKALAARLLGMNRKTLYRNIKKYHIIDNV